MTIDRYTKGVLTVIAVALVYICMAITPIGTKVEAQGGVTLLNWRDAGGKLHDFPVVGPAGNTNAVALPVFTVNPYRSQ